MRRKGAEKINRSENGFTLAELLIVVAIIAVLVAIAIPVFTSQLEKARESTDLANVRSAYAEVMAAVATEDETASYNGSVIKQSDGSYKAVVSLKQKQSGWQSKLPITIGGITSESTSGGTAPDPSHWVGIPGTTCTISYTQSGGIVFTWDGENSGSSEESSPQTSTKTSYSGTEFGTITNGTWNGSGTARVKNTGSSYYHSRRSTGSLVELDPNSTYTLTYTVPAGYSGPDVNIGTLLFTDNTGLTKVSDDTINDTTQKADSGWVSSTAKNISSNPAKNYQSTTHNTDGSTTVTQTINTDADHVWFGANFRVTPETVVAEDGTKTNSEYNLTENTAYLAAVQAAMNSLQITKSE